MAGGVVGGVAVLSVAAMAAVVVHRRRRANLWGQPSSPHCCHAGDGGGRHHGHEGGRQTLTVLTDNKGWTGLWNARAPAPAHSNSGSDDSGTLRVASLTKEKAGAVQASSAKRVVVPPAAAAAGPPSPEGPGWKRSSNGQLLSMNSGRVAPVSGHGATNHQLVEACFVPTFHV
jgi:hypothetical protein